MRRSIGFWALSAAIFLVPNLPQSLRGEEYRGMPIFLKRLLQDNALVSKRILGDVSGRQSVTYLSKGLPEECRKIGSRRQSADRLQDEVLLSLVNDTNAGGKTLVQVVGTQPYALSQPCVLAILQEIGQARNEGLQVVSSNLNRAGEGGHLYLEFALTGLESEGLRELIRSEIRAERWSRLQWQTLATMLFGAIMGIWGLWILSIKEGTKKNV